MSEGKATAASEATPVKPKKAFPTPIRKKGGRALGDRSLTVAEKAEAAALWRAGDVTLAQLSERFKKRPETFSKLFARMGIEKGSGAAAAMKRAEEVVTAKAVSEIEQTLHRIAKVKEDHYKMSQMMAVMVFKEIQQAKIAELDIGKLKDTMMVFKLASDVIAHSRKELFQILNVEKHEQKEDESDLPDLTVRELTQDEIGQLQDAPLDDDDDLGAGMLDLDAEDDE